MKELALILVVLAVAFAGKVQPPNGVYTPKCRIGEDIYDESASAQVPWFNVDLDAPAEERYKHIVIHYKKEIPAVINVIKEFASILGDIPLIKIIEDLVLDAYEGGKFPEPYRSELKGISDVTGVPIEDIAMMNIYYELSRFCTSIIAEAEGGDMYHARNLDFGQLFIWDIATQSWGLSDSLKKVTININFIKDGKILFKGTTFAGHVGIITGMKLGQYTLSMNAKVKSDLSYIIEWFTGSIQEPQFAMWVDRQVMEKTNTFEEAREYLSNVQMLAGCYYILGGNEHGEGVVIVRNQTSVMTERKLHDDNNDWFLLQTNYDPDQDPLFIDDRRDPGNWCMQNMTQKGVSKANLFKVLSSKTTLNKTTVHTVIMSVTKGIYETFIQYCPNPCWPF